MTGRWSVEKAVAWGQANPWYFGANFTPSTAINQLEFWQGDTFDAETLDRELGFAAGIGMNIMRVYLHDLLWQADADGFIGRIEKYLAIAEARGIRTMFTIFDDCWGDSPQLGPQPAPKPMTHNSGWVQSPGLEVLGDESQWGRLEKYVCELITRFGNDPRIAVWDLYNECGNAPGGAPPKHAQSAKLLAAAFDWARAAGPAAPLTAGLWGFEHDFLDGIFEIITTRSDIVTFHTYDGPDLFREVIGTVRGLCQDRPLVCTEYMARTRGCTFADCLPILRENNIGAINWGLVSGKTQTIYPWDWDTVKVNTDAWFHDIFNADGTLLYEDERAVIANVTAKQ